MSEPLTEQDIIRIVQDNIEFDVDERSYTDDSEIILSGIPSV